MIRLADFTDMFPWIRAPLVRSTGDAMPAASSKAPPTEHPPPRYNVAPTQAIAAVRNEPRPRVEWLHWGLIPAWANDPAIGNRMINARVETLDQKPAFRLALRRRRCVIPASGFYEWKKTGASRQPMYITRESGRPMPLAGLWDVWHDKTGSQILSCTIVTVPSSGAVAEIHDRMPAILREEDVKLWLHSGEAEAKTVLEVLRPFSAEPLLAAAVSRLVNNPRNDSAQCIEGITAPAEGEVQEKPRRRRKKGQDGTGMLFG